MTPSKRNELITEKNLMEGMYAKNIKNDRVYKVVCFNATDSTNGGNMEFYTIYTFTEPVGTQVYVRKFEEFLEKFSIFDSLADVNKGDPINELVAKLVKGSNTKARKKTA